MRNLKQNVSKKKKVEFRNLYLTTTLVPKNKYNNTVAKEDGLLKCAYCSTRYTAMWRPGPGGHGTLCNSCGIQWKQGEILKDAPVISPEEEKRLIKEKKERERIAELLEIERENKRVQKKVEREADVPPKKTTTTTALKQRQPKTTTNNIPNEITSESSATEDKKKITAKGKTVEKSNTVSAVEPVQIQPNEQTPQIKQQQTTQAQQQQAPQTQQPELQSQQNNSFFLYSQGGIPLPTLVIDFGDGLIFSHPNCAVTLLDGHFHIRLCTETGEQTLINLEKSDLADAQFNISQEGEPINIREVLIMTISPLKRPIQVLSQTLASEHAITIRFLEKLDPSGGAVVKRIIQRWLITIPQS